MADDIRPVYDPVIHDRETGIELWTVNQCSKFCGITPTTWRHYNRVHYTPKSVANIGTSALWNSDEVRRWQAARPRAGQGVPNPSNI